MYSFTSGIQVIKQHHQESFYLSPESVCFPLSRPSQAGSLPCDSNPGAPSSHSTSWGCATKRKKKSLEGSVWSGTGQLPLSWSHRLGSTPLISKRKMGVLFLKTRNKMMDIQDTTDGQESPVENKEKLHLALTQLHLYTVMVTIQKCYCVFQLPTA